MASITTNGGRLRVLNGAVDLLTDTLKVMLLGTAYTPDVDHQYVSDLGANELSGTGYVAGHGGSGRKTLASKTVAKDDTTNVVTFAAANLTWTAGNFGTVAYAAVIKEVTNAADSPVLCVLAISPNIVTNGGDYTLNLASGVMTAA